MGFKFAESIGRIEDALYGLSDRQLMGLTPSGARNILMDLGPAIREELKRAVLHGREEAAEVARNFVDEDHPGDGTDDVQRAISDTILNLPRP